MRRPASPLLLAQPGAMAGLTPRTARAVLAFVLALLILVVATLSGDGDASPPGAGSAAMLSGIVEGMRHGDDFYPVAAAAVRDTDGAVPAVLALPLPALAGIAARLPAVVAVLLLWALAAAAVLAWTKHLLPFFARPAGRAVAIVAIGGGCVAVLRPGLTLAPELWAGLFLALSLGRWQRGGAIEAVAFGLAAALIAPAAALYMLPMLVLAWHEGHRREALGWLLAMAIFAAILVAHAGAIVPVATPSGAAEAVASTIHGPGFAAAALAGATMLAVLPSWLGAMLVALALVGWAGWNDPRARRALAVLVGYGVLIAVAWTPDHGDGWGDGWPLLVAPLSLIGLAFVPDLLRDLTTAALDKRRITVRRMVR